MHVRSQSAKEPGTCRCCWDGGVQPGPHAASRPQTGNLVTASPAATGEPGLEPGPSPAATGLLEYRITLIDLDRKSVAKIPHHLDLDHRIMEAAADGL